MPITVIALQAALDSGIKSYNPTNLGWADPYDQYAVYNQLIIQIFGASVLAANNLHGGANAIVDTGFSSAADNGDAAPNFKVKSHLGAPAVCSVGTSGTVEKIAFCLQLIDARDFLEPTSETAYNAAFGGYPNGATAIPEHKEVSNTFTDIFMVITVSPGISVTAGGYLTVKGYTGVTGSENFTYVTLQSGS